MANCGNCSWSTKETVISKKWRNSKLSFEISVPCTTNKTLESWCNSQVRNKKSLQVKHQRVTLLRTKKYVTVLRRAVLFKISDLHLLQLRKEWKGVVVLVGKEWRSFKCKKFFFDVKIFEAYRTSKSVGLSEETKYFKTIQNSRCAFREYWNNSQKIWKRRKYSKKKKRCDKI